MILPGRRETSMIHELEKIIPTAAGCGGICIGIFIILYLRIVNNNS